MSETHDLRENWGWMMLFGCLMVLLGIFAVAYAAVFTVVSVLWLAWILIIAGVIEGICTRFATTSKVTWSGTSWRRCWQS